MATEMHWYDGGVWKKAIEMHVWDSNASQWKEAMEVYIWDGSAWKKCHVSPNYCILYSGATVSSITDCGVSLSSTFYVNNIDPAANYSTSDCYIYSDSGCGNGIGSGFTQLDVNGTAYNFETNGASKIIAAFMVNC